LVRPPWKPPPHPTQSFFARLALGDVALFPERRLFFWRSPPFFPQTLAPDSPLASFLGLFLRIFFSASEACFFGESPSFSFFDLPSFSHRLALTCPSRCPQSPQVLRFPSEDCNKGLFHHCPHVATLNGQDPNFELFFFVLGWFETSHRGPTPPSSLPPLCSLPPLVLDVLF